MAKILLLEDDADFAELLTFSLEESGHEVTLASDAAEALSHYRVDQFDVIVSDLIIKKEGRPVPDGGLILIWRAKEMAKARDVNVPIIAISGSIHYPGMQHALITAKSTGADRVMAKPFSPRELLECISNVLEKNRFDTGRINLASAAR